MWGGDSGGAVSAVAVSAVVPAAQLRERSALGDADGGTPLLRDSNALRDSNGQRLPPSRHNCTRGRRLRVPSTPGRSSLTSPTPRHRQPQSAGLGTKTAPEVRTPGRKPRRIGMKTRLRRLSATPGTPLPSRTRQQRTICVPECRMHRVMSAFESFSKQRLVSRDVTTGATCVPECVGSSG